MPAALYRTSKHHVWCMIGSGGVRKGLRSGSSIALLPRGLHIPSRSWQCAAGTNHANDIQSTTETIPVLLSPISLRSFGSRLEVLVLAVPVLRRVGGVPHGRQGAGGGRATRERAHLRERAAVPCGRPHRHWALGQRPAHRARYLRRFFERPLARHSANLDRSDMTKHGV